MDSAVLTIIGATTLAAVSGLVYTAFRYPKFYQGHFQSAILVAPLLMLGIGWIFSAGFYSGRDPASIAPDWRIGAGVCGSIFVVGLFLWSLARSSPYRDRD